MEKLTTTNSTPRLKIPKSISFRDSDLSEKQHPDTKRHSTVAGLWVNVLERHGWCHETGESNTH